MVQVTDHPANAMLAQLGGNRFLTMTGAKDLMSADNPQPRLIMSLPTNLTKSRGSKMEISLTPDDLYTLVFFRMWGGQRKFVDVRRGVGCEQLRSVFEDMTGLRTSLS